MVFENFLKIDAKYLLQILAVWWLVFLNPLFNGVTNNLFFAIYITLTIFLINKFYEGFKLNINKELLLVLLSFIFIFTLPSNIVNIDLVADELYHSQQANMLGIKVTRYIVDKTNLFDEYKLNNILRCINLIIFLFFLALFKSYKLIKNKFIYLFLFIIAIKFGLFLLNIEYGDPHPPARLFSIWIFSFLIGVNDIGLRLSTTVGLAILATVLYNEFKKNEKVLIAYLLSLTICTIPLLLFVGGILDTAIYSILIWTLILIEVRKNSESINYSFIFFLASIGSLVRSPVVIIFVPIVIFFALDLLRNSKLVKINSMLPLLVCLPYIYTEATHRTPSTTEGGTINKLLSSFYEFKSMHFLIDNIGILWLLFIPLGFLLNLKNNKFIAFYLFYTLSIYILFYSINSSFFGHYKYQAEIAVPMLIIGFMSLHDWVCEKKSF